MSMAELASLYKLPRLIEAEHPDSGLLTMLQGRSRKLWEEGMLDVPVLDLTDQLKQSLLAARRSGSIIRGIEAAAEDMQRQRRGLELLNRHTPQGERISRLVLMSRDGTKNFYRKAEGLLTQHSPLVLGCMVDCDNLSLGSLLFGPGMTAKLLLVSHKQDVCRILLSLLAESPAVLK
jgi:hypothetical protein